MTRRARQESATEIYHIVLGSINHQQIFEDDDDRRKFLYILSDCQEKYRFKVYAYCLMSNHVHMVMKITFPQLSKCIQNLLTRFVRWYNRKYDRTGQLMQTNFWSQPIENTRYLIAAIQYIHQNPVNANMCRFASEYVWSSCQFYYGKKDPLLHPESIIELFGSMENIQSILATYFDADFSLSEFEPPEKEKPVIEDHAQSIFHSITGCRSASDFQKLPLKERNQYICLLKNKHLTQNQISRFSGISRSTICRVLKNYNIK